PSQYAPTTIPTVSSRKTRQTGPAARAAPAATTVTVPRAVPSLRAPTGPANARAATPARAIARIQRAAVPRVLDPRCHVPVPSMTVSPLPGLPGGLNPSLAARLRCPASGGRIARLRRVTRLQRTARRKREGDLW